MTRELAAMAMETYLELCHHISRAVEAVRHG